MRTFYRISIVWGISLLAMAAAALAQPNPDTLWTRTYGGDQNDWAGSVQHTADGGYIVAGYTYSYGVGSADVYLVKTDGSGNTVWTRTYGGSYGDEAFCVQQTADGGYIVAGGTNSFGVGTPNYCNMYLVKTDGSAGDTLWTRTYGGSSTDWAESVQQTADGGYIVAGTTRSFGATEYDFYVVKTNSQSDTLWTRTYGGNGDDQAHSVQQTADSGYIVAGHTNSFGMGTPDYPNMYLVKTNGSGDTLWTRTYGGSGHDVSYSVDTTADGGYIVAGRTDSFGAGLWDFYLVKTNSLGEPLWTRTYGGSSYDAARSVQQTSDGGYIVAGFTQSFGAGGQDFYLVKTNSLGQPLWTRTYGGSSHDAALSVQQTSDGGYIVAGYSRSFGAGWNDFYLVKTNSLGDTLWTRTYGGSRTDASYSVDTTADGGYIVAGYTESFGAGGGDFYLVKTNSSGDTLWTRTFGGSGTDAAYYVQQTSDGGYIVAGSTGSFGAGGDDFYLVKTNSLGATLWTRTYGGIYSDEARSVQKTSDGGYIVAGYTGSFGAGYNDFYLVKTGPDDPWGLVIMTSGGNVVLRWLPTGAASYNIYGATLPFVEGVLLDVTSNTTWTDGNTSSRPSPYFYYVMPAP